MKRVKMAALLVVAALMAFAAPASADQLTSNGSVYSGGLTGDNEAGHITMTGPLGIKIACSGHLGGTVTSQGAGLPIVGSVTEILISNCTNGYAVTSITKGTITATAIGSGPNATIFSNGTETTVHTPLGFNCVYRTSSTHFGTFTGSTTTGGTATMDVSAAMPRISHSSLCGATGILTGSAVVTVPDNLNVHDN
jgi:hypothetical protein